MRPRTGLRGLRSERGCRLFTSLIFDATPPPVLFVKNISNSWANACNTPLKNPGRIIPYMQDLQHTIETVHQFVGYPVIFLLVPAALITFGGKQGHRAFGLLYIATMVFLYCTGTFMTLTRHDWGTWEFYRNVTFNFFGFSLLIYGYRAMYLARNFKQPTPQNLDYMLAWLLTLSTVALFMVAVFKNTPMRVYTLIGVILVIMEWRELAAGYTPKAVLYRRHIRFILASYFYALTVVSILHLNDELPRNWKWLWPTALGIVMVYGMTTVKNSWIRQHKPAVMRASVYTLLGVIICFGIYVVIELTGHPNLLLSM